MKTRQEQEARMIHHENASVKVMRVIKVEVEGDQEEKKLQKFIMAMLAAVSLSIVTQ